MWSNTGAIALSGTNTSRTFTLTGTNTGNNTLTGILGDNGTGPTSLVKSGSGTWVLAGANTYTGGTVVSGGTLTLTGSLASGVVVQNGGTLAQSGVVNGNVVLEAGAAYSPGGGGGMTGQATVNGSLSVNSGATLSFDIGGTNQGSASGGYDYVTGVTQLNLSGKLSINLVNGFLPTAGQSFTLLDWSNLATPSSVTASGYQLDFSNALLSPGLSWDVSQFLTTGTILVDAVVVPEPSRWLLMFVGGMVVALRRRR
jgi:autotransporter-associated beta strand protein